MKRRFFLFVLFITILFTNVKVNAFEIVEPTNDFYVNDYANVLDATTKNYIMDHSVNLYNKNGTQIVVVTVPDLDGASIEDYGLKLAREFGIGSKEKNNGLLILLAIEERKVRIEVGYGLEEDINDAKAGRIIDDYMISFLKNDEFNNGILNGYKAVYEEIVNYYNLDLEVDKPQEEEVPIEVMIIVAMVAIVYIIIVVSSLKNGGTGGGFYIGGGSSGGSHSSGHSSFGGFSGGGGSFGGGGASRGF